MKNKALILIVILVIAVIGGIYYFASHQEKLEISKIRVSTNKIPYSTLYVVAKEKGFFKEEGLDVETVIVGTGREGLDALINKNVEINFVADTPMANLGVKSTEVQLVATLAEGLDIDLIVRKDKGINQPTDLKGKKIGTQKGTTMEFFASKFFETNGISKDEVEIQNIGIKEMAVAFQRGDFDAITSFEPHTNKILRMMEDKAATFSLITPGVQLLNWNVAVRREFFDNHPIVIKRFLQALIKAEKYTRDNKEEVISIVSQFTEIEKEILAQIWNKYDLKLVLKNSLLNQLKDQGEWILESEGGGSTLPDYRLLINEKYLKDIAPERVDF